jgi:hypothetical protein
VQSLNQPVARTVTEDRLRATSGRVVAGEHAARPPGTVRRSVASVAGRVAMRLDADTARRATAA